MATNTSDFKNGILYKAKCYLAGNLEFESFDLAVDWRVEFTKKVKNLGIVTLSPIDNLFVNYDKEDKDFQDKLKFARQNGEFDYVHEKMKEIRSRDLWCVDVSTFVVAVLNPNIPTVGTVDELIVAKRQNKPVFLVLEGGYRRLPLWWCSYFKKEWVYENLDQVVDRLKLIDSGEVEVNPKYWRLLKSEYL